MLAFKNSHSYVKQRRTQYPLKFLITIYNSPTYESLSVIPLRSLFEASLLSVHLIEGILCGNRVENPNSC